MDIFNKIEISDKNGDTDFVELGDNSNINMQVQNENKFDILLNGLLNS